MLPLGLLWLLPALLLGGCATLGYYGQAIGGEISILARARNIDEVVDDPSTPAATRQKLEQVQKIRAFAIRDLKLPDTRSYLSYTDLERPYVLWNVFVAPEFSTTLREWCFPVAGCVAYRGYFSRQNAGEFAAARRAAGDDVYVGGVTAYSTLGWFSDPVLSTVMDRSDTELAGLIFHELAHQKLYVPGDSEFNESFAMVVQIEGVRRWLAHRGETAGQGCPGCGFAGYLERLKRRDEFVALVLDYRGRLDRLYASDADAETKLAKKREIFASLRADYEKLRERWGGYGGYDDWFAQGLNNAKLAAVGTYYKYVAPLQRLLAEQHGDLDKFYRAAAELARLPREQRIARLMTENWPSTR